MGRVGGRREEEVETEFAFKFAVECSASCTDLNVPWMRVQVPASPHINWMTLGKLPTFSEIQFLRRCSWLLT